jgi:hypothetical protein
MLNDLFFDSENNFVVVGVEKREGKVLVMLKAHKMIVTVLCVIGKASGLIATISGPSLIYLLGNETWIRLRFSKFYCKNDMCMMKVFSERFDIHFMRGKRTTNKVHDKV